MILKLYSVFDRNTGVFGSPVQAQNEMMLRRSIDDLFLQEASKHPLEQHVYARYPDSFDVYVIGEFESDNGVISPCQPSLIARLAEWATLKG